MDVFISWSGEKSKALAQALAEWLPNVVQAADPWLSVDSLTSGVRWTPELTSRLQDTNFGILAITPESVNEPWLVYEAGAISKMSGAKLVPVVMGVDKAIIGPLGQFQARDVSREDLLVLCRDVNLACGSAAIPESRVSKQFDRCWDEVESALAEVSKIADATGTVAPGARRESPEMVEEILLRVRAMQQAPSEPAEPSSRRLMEAVHEIASIDGRPHEIEYSVADRSIEIHYAITGSGRRGPSQNVQRVLAVLSKYSGVRIEWTDSPDVAPF